VALCRVNYFRGLSSVVFRVFSGISTWSVTIRQTFQLSHPSEPKNPKNRQDVMKHFRSVPYTPPAKLIAPTQRKQPIPPNTPHFPLPLL
jgi:hypothetical protein